jgi:hypothetical protein
VFLLTLKIILGIDRSKQIISNYCSNPAKKKFYLQFEKMFLEHKNENSKKQ